jgi:hypothetical protein
MPRWCAIFGGMRRLLLFFFLFCGCIKTQQPSPVAILPDKETVRKLRELSAEASVAEQPKAGELTAILVRARVQLWAIANASGDEAALIFAAEASSALTVCTGERNDECDAAIAAQLEKDLKEIERGKDTKTVLEIAPLVVAMQKLSIKDPDGMIALRKLSEENSWRGTAARLFILGRLTEAWASAARGSTIKALSPLRNLALLACPADSLRGCLPKTDLSAWNQEGADAIAFANIALSLLQKLSTEDSDFAKSAQKYSLPNIEKQLQALLPLPPPVIQKQLPSAERWTNAALAFPQSVPSDLLPRFYISAQGGTLRFGVPPALRIINKKIVFLEDALGVTFPGKELDKSKLSASIEAQWRAFQGATKEIDPALPEQLDTVSAAALMIEATAPLSDLVAISQALTEIKLTSQLLLVSPKKAPAAGDLAFGAALPMTLGKNADYINLQSDGSFQATINGAPQSFANRDELIAQASLFTKAPSLVASSTTPVGQLVSLYDDLRVATKGVWGPIEKAPITVSLE